MTKQKWEFNIKLSAMLLIAVLLHVAFVKLTVEEITPNHELFLAVFLGAFGFTAIFRVFGPFVFTLADKHMSTDEMRRNTRKHPLGKYFIIGAED